MSFSSLAKAAASQMPRHNDESRAMLYGMLVFSHTFSENEVSFRTETAEVSDIFCGLLLGELDIMAVPEMYQKEVNVIYHIKISDASSISKIKNAFAQNGFFSIDRSLLSSQRAVTAFLKGAFISCGYINPPNKPYRLDFTVKDADLAVELAVIISQALGKMPKMSVRRSYQVVYCRDSELILDFLNLIGLNSTAFAIMNGQIERDIRNNLNRKNNFDIANIGKTAQTSLIQTEAINALISSGEFEKLPVTLRQTARLRLKYPDASLEELGRSTDPPVSKSQISKRLRQIVDIYKSK